MRESFKQFIFFLFYYLKVHLYYYYYYLLDTISLDRKEFVLTKEGMAIRTSFVKVCDSPKCPGLDFCVAFSTKRTLLMYEYVRFGLTLYPRLASDSG